MLVSRGRFPPSACIYRIGRSKRALSWTLFYLCFRNRANVHRGGDRFRLGAGHDSITFGRLDRLIREGSRPHIRRRTGRREEAHSSRGFQSIPFLSITQWHKLAKLSTKSNAESMFHRTSAASEPRESPGKPQGEAGETSASKQGERTSRVKATLMSMFRRT